MREALVAVFDTAPHADEAVRALEKANVPPTDIRRYHKDDPSIPRANYGVRRGSRGRFIPPKASIMAFGHGCLGKSIAPIGVTPITWSTMSSSTRAQSARVTPWSRCTFNQKPPTV
jgi:hypothetical protein